MLLSLGALGEFSRHLPYRASEKNVELNQAFGRSHGGRTTKIHALTDGLRRPVAFLLTGGNVADCKAGEVWIDQMPATSLLKVDKGYDSDAILRQVKQRGAVANIPPGEQKVEELLLATPLP